MKYGKQNGTQLVYVKIYKKFINQIVYLLIG